MIYIVILIFILIITLYILLKKHMKNIVVTNFDIVTDKLNSEADNLNIVQLSDLHSVVFGNDNDKLINIIDELNPDVIVVTGDMVSITDTNIDSTLKLMKRLVGKYPVYYSYGNHELYNINISPYDLMKTLTKIGVKVLNNKSIKINESINLIGIPFVKATDKLLRNPEKKVLKSQNNNKYNILLAHNPDGYKLYKEYNLDIILSGHIHGGEIRIFDIGLLSPNRKLFPKYSAGMYDNKLIVNRGLGDSTFKLRICNTPEIINIKIRKNNFKNI